MIYIVGEGFVKQMQAFNDVRDALCFDNDVYLGAMLAKPLGIDLKNVGVYNMEPLHDESPLWAMGYMETLRNCHVIDYSKKNIEYLKKYGIDAFHMPYGYHDKLSRCKNTKKDIEVLFVGSTHHKRREELLNKISDHFDLVVATDSYGKELDSLVPRAKLHINIHHFDDQQLQVVRLNYLIANGCNIVSERGCEQEVNMAYENMLTFSEYENFVETCYVALENKVDGSDLIKEIPHNCTSANNWLNERMK